jgi:diguanylate cyclase (GGDEF)-like protein
MSGYATVNFSESDEGLFTPAEIVGLMETEYTRAKRYGYPASLILIAVDRLEYLHDLYGLQSKEEILQAVIKLLRSTTRDSDFLGCMRDDRIMAVFPHTTEETIQAITTRLLRVCRDLDFRTDGRALRATLSIGIATIKKDTATEFGDFVTTAEEALAFAVDSGGDRSVTRESAAAVFEDLREELEDESRRLSQAHERAVEQTSQEVPVIVDLPETDLAENLRGVFRKHGRAQDLMDLEADVIQLAEASLQAAREDAVSRTVGEHLREIDVLERRVTKLRELLDTTETELARIADAKGIDAGVASIYRTVQGLRGDERGFEQKKEMLSLIFEANLELQKKKRSGDS